MSRAAGARLPGLLPSLGFTWLYVSAMVLLPLACLGLKAAGASWGRILEILLAPRTLTALGVSFGCAFVAALLNAVFGLVVGWSLSRYDFPGRSLLEGMVELPFALPTAVAGITLAHLYSPQGWFGSWAAWVGLEVSFTRLGIIIAMTFVGLPFVVRTLQPVIEEMDPQVEEAAASLGASRWLTFWRVQFPTLVPALLTGFALALARAIGEYGSVIFISGNRPFRTEIAPLLVVAKLEQYDYEGAAVLAVAMLVISLGLLALIHRIERGLSRRLLGVEAEVQ